MKKLLKQIGYNGDLLDIEYITDFIVNKRINFYVKMQHSSQNIYWMVYIEPFDEIGRFEFKYLWEDRKKAVKAAIVASICYILEPEKYLTSLTDIIMDKWIELGLDPEFNIIKNVGPSDN